MSKNPKRAGDNIAEENINSYIQDLLEKGYSEEAIRQQLQRYGYEEEDINNALEDAKLTAECFSRLLNGKNLFPEYAKFKIPDYLKK